MLKGKRLAYGYQLFSYTFIYIKGMAKSYLFRSVHSQTTVFCTHFCAMQLSAIEEKH